MRFAAARFLPVSILFLGAAGAQNSDIGLLLGVSKPQGRVLASREGPSVSAAVGASGQFNFAAQVLRTGAGDLYVEIPFVVAAQVYPSVAWYLTGRLRETVYLTPGVRLKIPVSPRLALYAAVGAGLASQERVRASIRFPDVEVAIDRITGGALGFGGGANFRLTRLLSLRLEGRDFVSRAGAVTSSRHQTIVQGGIGFHF